MARVTRARYKEIQQEERDLQRNRTRFSWKEESPKTPSRQQRYAIPAGAHFHRAVAPPRYAGSESSDDDSENSKGEFRMYIKATPTPPRSRKTSPRSPAEFMVVNDSGAAEIFKNLPLEIHQNIALYLPEDNDIFNYSLTCRKTADAISNSVWRKRFLQYFDDAPGLSPEDIRWKYAFRRDVCKKWICFDLHRLGLGRIDRDTQQVQAYNQDSALKVISSLLLESNAAMVSDDNGYQVVRGLNLQFISDLLTGDNGASHIDIVDSIFNTSFDKDANKSTSVCQIITAAQAHTLIYVIQLCLTPFNLHPDYCNFKVNHFDISQYQAYSAPASQPVFDGLMKQEVNVRWLLHVVNFFKYHMKSDGEGLLAHDYKELDADQIPQFWAGKIQGGTQPLGHHWKGAYMYMENVSLSSLRRWDGRKSIISQDCLDGDESFQDMDVFFDCSQNSKYDWPAEWERVLCSNPFEDPEHQALATKAGIPLENMPSVRQFWGSCRGSRRGHFFGRIHAVTTQQGFHGFQRITMMKFYTQVDNNGEHVYDPSQVWAYEGCVLPGGRIIVGRWWGARGDPDAIDTTSGPFIWWNVNRSGTNDLIEEHEAFDFLDSFQDPILIVD